MSEITLNRACPVGCPGSKPPRRKTMDEPRWTTMPPTEPGWYWVIHKPGRLSGNTMLCHSETAQIVNLDECDGGGLGVWGGDGCYVGADPGDFEWWPIPIEEPPR